MNERCDNVAQVIAVPIVIRQAAIRDLDAIKKIADANRKEIGFVLRPVLMAGIARGEVHCAFDDGVVGFVHWHMRLDGWCTIYEIATAMPGKGIGTMLLKSVPKPLQLKCPDKSSANGFYEKNGGNLVATVDGRKRRLNIWQWSCHYD